jgi:integrase
MGRLKGTKTGAERTVRLLQPLAQDLAEWRLAQGRPEPGTIVFPGESPDGTLTEGQWNRWTQGTFRAAKLAVGLPTARAYDLRHSFVSLLIHEGQSILDVARQAGHSPQTCLRDYGHLFDEFDPAKREPAEAVIGAARASSYLSRTFRRTPSGAKPLIARKTPTAGSPTAGKSDPKPRPRAGHSGL